MTGFTQFYIRYEKQVFRFLVSLTGDKALAEELTQETFYRAFLNIDRFENRCEVYTWLCQIAKNAYFKELRRRKRLFPLDALPCEAPDGTPALPERLVERETVERLRYHLSTLDEPYREVFTLRVFGALPYREIAAICGKSESYARVTYYRAKEKLIEALAREESGNCRTKKEGSQ